ncbi:hypothetical protein PCANB_000410 [Pneumocystis canis]|nr:hypothetical protein PCK1_000361 [Pneumocystis canis]KAG5438063.1 hypothetical protein PCANB_000410 [Pneumocystis canis]
MPENPPISKKCHEIQSLNTGNISLESIIGLRVKIRTLLDETQMGQIYAYDSITNTLMLQKESKTSVSYPMMWDFIILKISSLKDIQVIKQAKNTSKNNHSSIIKDFNFLNRSKSCIRPVSLSVLPAREQASRKEHQAAIARIGIGVTQEAQNLFDSLSKTLPCRWEKQSIIVLDEIYIDPPYTVEACWTDSKDSKSYLRVCKVLEGERQRLDTTVHRGG